MNVQRMHRKKYSSHSICVIVYPYVCYQLHTLLIHWKEGADRLFMACSTNVVWISLKRLCFFMMGKRASDGFLSWRLVCRSGDSSYLFVTGHRRPLAMLLALKFLCAKICWSGIHVVPLHITYFRVICHCMCILVHVYTIPLSAAY